MIYNFDASKTSFLFHLTSTDDLDKYNNNGEGNVLEPYTCKLNLTCSIKDVMYQLLSTFAYFEFSQQKDEKSAISSQKAFIFGTANFESDKFSNMEEEIKEIDEKLHKHLECELGTPQSSLLF